VDDPIEVDDGRAARSRWWTRTRLPGPT